MLSTAFQILIKQIEKGVFKPSEQIPTEMELNKIPFCHTTSFLNSDRFPGIQNHIEGNFSLYELLKKRYDVEATRASSSFEVSMPENSYMDILQISPKIPLLVVKSIAKDPDGEVVEYCITKFRGDICSIAVYFDGEGR